MFYLDGDKVIDNSDITPSLIPLIISDLDSLQESVTIFLVKLSKDGNYYFFNLF